MTTRPSVQGDPREDVVREVGVEVVPVAPQVGQGGYHVQIKTVSTSSGRVVQQLDATAFGIPRGGTTAAGATTPERPRGLHDGCHCADLLRHETR